MPGQTSKTGKITKKNRPREGTFERDMTLLKEYGFKNRTVGSASLNLKKIDGFGMRQLDRLKMLLLRNEGLIGNYPERIRKGIEHNNLRSFAEALALLSPKLRESIA